MAVITMSSSGRLTLPADVRRQLNLEEGAELEVEVDAAADAIVLRPAVLIRREDAWAYTVEHRQLLSAAHADSLAGRARSLSEEDLAGLGEGRKRMLTCSRHYDR